MPKYKLEDRVSVLGQPGTVVGVSDRPELLSDGSRQHLYAVRLGSWLRVEKSFLSGDGEEFVKVYYQKPGTTDKDNRRDHEYDTLGCVPESALSPE